MLDQSPWAFWIVPASVALVGFVYGVTLIGQGLGAQQMYVVRSLVDRTCVDPLDGPIDVYVPRPE